MLKALNYIGLQKITPRKPIFLSIKISLSKPHYID